MSSTDLRRRPHSGEALHSPSTKAPNRSSGVDCGDHIPSIDPGSFPIPQPLSTSPRKKEEGSFGCAPLRWQLSRHPRYQALLEKHQ
jgi:hypothetical protein